MIPRFDREAWARAAIALVDFVRDNADCPTSALNHRLASLQADERALRARIAYHARADDLDTLPRHLTPWQRAAIRELYLAGRTIACLTLVRVWLGWEVTHTDIVRAIIAYAEHDPEAVHVIPETAVAYVDAIYALERAERALIAAAHTDLCPPGHPVGHPALIFPDLHDEEPLL